MAAVNIETQVPREPDVDENGVDRAQIRAMLDLSPAERLARMTEFANALVAIRDGMAAADPLELLGRALRGASPAVSVPLASGDLGDAYFK